MRPLASWALLSFLVTACSGPAPAALQPRYFRAFRKSATSDPPPRVVETPRELANFHYIEGYHALDSQNFPEATEHLKKVLRLEPGTLTAQCGLGRAYVEQGMYVEAIAPLEDAFSPWPAFRQIYTEAREFPELLPLVRALVATGNEARATEVLLASGSSLAQASAEVARHKRALAGK
jgi:tetratricopeptide (TPR) repeat protein